MLPQTEARKYQLFPKENQAMTLQGKGLDPEQAFAFAMGQDGDKTDKSHMGSLRVRMRDHNLIRRRKVSVPELGPMTTVHEATIDSPTLPGRPAFHERSISAPGNNWLQDNVPERASTEEVDPSTSSDRAAATASPSEMNSRQPQSPKSLPPLLIPVQTSSQPRPTRQPSQSRLRSGSTSSIEPNYRSARTDDSPKTRTPYTPVSSATTASTASTLPTPVSATIDSRASPQHWKYEISTTSKEQSTDANQSNTTPKSAVEAGPKSSANYHRRNVSESSSISGSIMDRGRPRKKVEPSAPKRAGSKSGRSAERRAFEALPKGWKVPDAVHMLEHSEVAALQKQAAQQAARFEIMRKEDVDSLSKELRDLDERAEYLRRTYHSLRTGRRNLHSRICQYLRSPRVAKFNHEPMLKQEEALAELDASIDDWVSRLEQTENRRTRIRQKLLEHVAAAVALPVSGRANVHESYQIALGIAPASAPAGTSTPPRSPVKIAFTPITGSPSHSPHRGTAHVPSTILELPVVEEAATSAFEVSQPQQDAAGEKNQEGEDNLTAGIRRAAVESIRIYAGDEVAALLNDVEQQMIRMSKATDQVSGVKDKDGNMSSRERKELHRAHSHEALEGGLRTVSSEANLKASASTSTAGTPKTSSSSSSSTPQSVTPTATEPKEAPGEFLLTSAVFNPKTAVAQ